MLKFHRSNVDTLSDADIVIIGVPDESRSNAKRKGTSAAPDMIRLASNESEFFYRHDKIIPTSPMRGSFLHKTIMDFGNVERGDLSKLVIDIISHEKVPIIIGGDHSITTLALAAIGKILGRLSILYFDAHPDFVSSTKNYYGSVMTDSADFIDFEKSMLIGTRAAEPEEIENAAKAGMQIITPLDLTELGLVNVARRFAAADKKYISIDLDCVDPAFAPGVSVPSPGGLSSIDLLYLVKKAISTGVIAMDIVELSPNFDLNNVTANLAARILSESIASMD